MTRSLSGMALNLRSLKTRAALANATAIALILGGNAVYNYLTHRNEEGELRRSFEEHAVAFARLTYVELARAFEEEGPASERLRTLLRAQLQLEPDFQRIAILGPSGEALAESGPDPAPELSAAHRAAVREAIGQGRFRTLSAGEGSPLEVIAPYPASTPARFAVSYRHGFSALTPILERHHVASLSVSAISVLTAMLVAIALASRITRPIEELTRGALEIGQGNFERRLEVHGNDEVQMLARTFNEMADRLKENIAQLEESNRRLAALNEELQELDRTKSDLLANVSHELRTPLTAIKGYTDYILEGKLGPVGEKQEKGLIVIQRISLNLQPFALPMLVEQIHQSLRSEFERKQIDFGTELAPDLPSVIADRDRLAQVLENLLINALKFTPAGGRISVSACRAAQQDKPQVEVSVRDSGIGIPATEVGRIFNRFHQVDGSSTRRYGGVGLGLAIVKSVLDAHGAPITVDSAVGQGSVFRFLLPAHAREEARPAAPLPGYP
jgi:signal transduction histidine kinase